jgi:PhnB protein
MNDRDRLAPVRAAARPATAKKMRNRLSEHPALMRPLNGHAGNRAPECGAAISHVLATHSMEIIMDLNTYLFFDGQCEDAFRLYEKVLGGKMTGLMRYADAPSGPAAFKGCNRVIHVSLRVGDRVLMGSDTPPDGLEPMPSGHRPDEYKTPQGFRANVTVDTPAEAERIYHALAEGGAIAMPMAETFFARRFGMLHDRFGTPWMITCLKPMPAAEDEASAQSWS